MHKIFCVFGFLLLIQLMNGCATTPSQPNDKPLSDALYESREGSAVLVGQGGGIKGFLKSLATQLGTYKHTYLLSIDGFPVEKSSARKATEYWIKPGTYKFSLYCQMTTSALLVHDYAFVDRDRNEIEVSVEAGKEYLIDSVMSRKKYGLGYTSVCIPYIRMKT